MNALLVISACICAAAGRPQYYPYSAGYVGQPYAAVAPYSQVTYDYNVIPDTAEAPAAPGPYALAPPLLPTEYKDMHHSQDEFGQFAFGHSSLLQAHTAVRDFTGAVQGSYTYIDADGNEVIAKYIADQGGFRVSSNALPVAPIFEGEAPVAPEIKLEAPVFDLEAPVFDLEPAQDTPEVAAAREEHFRLVEEHKAILAAALAADTAEEPAEAPVEAPAEEPAEAPALAVDTAEEPAEVPALAADTADEPVEAPADEHAEAPAEEAAAEPVQYTPEVAAAREEHFRLVEEHKAAVAAALAADTAEAPAEEPAEVPAELNVAEESPVEVTDAAPDAPEEAAPEKRRRKRHVLLGGQVLVPEFYRALPAEPVLLKAESLVQGAIGAAALRDVELLRVVHNPDHAVTYRVD